MPRFTADALTSPRMWAGVSWLGALGLLTAAMAPRLAAQLCSLERRTGRGSGRDVVDHPPGGHDDVINSAAGACVLASGPSGLAIWAALGR